MMQIHKSHTHTHVQQRLRNLSCDICDVTIYINDEQKSKQLLVKVWLKSWLGMLYSLSFLNLHFIVFVIIAPVQTDG
jgi:hypothetical protein